jgi:hypothetical protein
MGKFYFKLFSCIFSILFFYFSHGQELNRQSFISQGNGKVTSNGFIINQSIGQPSLLGSYSNSSVIIQQGFQQTSFQGKNFNTSLPANSTIVVVYPNPFYDIVNLQFSTQLNEKVEVIFYDVQGRTVLHSNYLLNGALLRITNIGYLPAGNYFISLKSSTLKYESIIIKQ